jgi:hypothetical protein
MVSMPARRSKGLRRFMDRRDLAQLPAGPG